MKRPLLGGSRAGVIPPVEPAVPATDAVPADPVPALPPDVSLDLRNVERETAVAQLFDVQYVQLVRLAALLGARSDAEDVVAEAFCSLYSRWNRLRDASAALPYLRSCVVNEAKMRLRHRQVVERNADPAVDHLRSAEAEVLIREVQREVLAALDALPTRQREAIVLRYWMDLRETEVAATMGVSVGTVKTHTSRAMAALAARLELKP